jgi:peptidoglycan/xylan/chitin deacetylase (PgdA/CDA1 family)
MERAFIPILLYHSVDAQVARPYQRWAVTPETFDRHMALVKQSGCVPMTVSHLVAAMRNGTRLSGLPLLITFDDGLLDFLTGAFPVLQRYQFPATLYVVAGRVGLTASWLDGLGEGDRPMLSWAQLRELQAAGIEIGAHTVTHPQLDLLKNGIARHEILESKRILDRHLNSAVTSFAYPHGYSTGKVRELVREAGYTSACRVRNALSAVDEDSFALSRITIENTTSDDDIRRFISGQGLPVAPPLGGAAQYAWRQWRRLSRLAA